MLRLSRSGETQPPKPPKKFGRSVLPAIVFDPLAHSAFDTAYSKWRYLSAEETCHYRRACAVKGVGAAVALFGYFPVARYFHILTTAALWALVARISIVNSTAFGFYVARPLCTGYKKREELLETIIAGALVIVTCAATLLRLVNAAPGLFGNPTVRHWQITNARVIRPKRYTFPTHRVDQTLDDGGAVSLDISCATYYSLGVGDKVEVRAQVWAVGNSVCLGDCVSRGSRQPPAYVHCN